MDASAGWESLAVSWGCSLAGTTLGGDRPLMIGNDPMDYGQAHARSLSEPFCGAKGEYPLKAGHSVT